MRHASDAMAAADLGALERVVVEHPELLHPSDDDVAVRRTLIGAALRREWSLGADAMRPVMDWLAARGFDRQRELNALLCGSVGMPADEVRDLLARGADPAWVAPNGIPVLEHALLRYWNAEAVDLVAARVTPRRALWIAAGLGDVDGVRGFLDARGRPTRAARRLRPDFDAAGPGGIPSLPDPDDEELLVEALFVAVLNGRAAVIAELAARGAPVNSLLYGLPLVFFAAANGLTASLEALVRCGADLDLRGRHPDQSAREVAREFFEQRPDLGERRRVVALCGMDPDAVLAERDARPAPTPQFDGEPQFALELAADDALRLGEPEVRAEHVLVGQLRADGFARSYLIGERWLTADQLRAAFGDRLRPADDRAPGPPPPLGASALAVVDAAVALATARRRAWLDGSYLLAALAADGGPAAELLARHGKDAAAMRAALEKTLGRSRRVRRWTPGGRVGSTEAAQERPHRPRLTTSPTRSPPMPLQLIQPPEKYLMPHTAFREAVMGHTRLVLTHYLRDPSYSKFYVGITQDVHRRLREHQRSKPEYRWMIPIYETPVRE